MLFVSQRWAMPTAPRRIGRWLPSAVLRMKISLHTPNLTTKNVWCTRRYNTEMPTAIIPQRILRPPSTEWRVRRRFCSRFRVQKWFGSLVNWATNIPSITTNIPTPSPTSTVWQKSLCRHILTIWTRTTTKSANPCMIFTVLWTVWGFITMWCSAVMLMQKWLRLPKP